ncbi:hypothetical protein KUF73_19400 [Pseudomonas sp. PD9R]|nr:hypothetical protein [Pseudomonas sp. PD9R]
MTGFKNLILAFTVLGASTAAHAADDNFTSRVFGQTSDKVKKSRVLSSSSVNAVVGNDSAWGARLGQQNSQSDYYVGYDNVSVSHNGIKLRQEDLMGRYDLSNPSGVSKQS